MPVLNGAAVVRLYRCRRQQPDFVPEILKRRAFFTIASIMCSSSAHDRSFITVSPQFSRNQCLALKRENPAAEPE